MTGETLLTDEIIASLPGFTFHDHEWIRELDREDNWFSVYKIPGDDIPQAYSPGLKSLIVIPEISKQTQMLTKILDNVTTLGELKQVFFQETGQNLL